jgi:FkbM family methyltransferase
MIASRLGNAVGRKKRSLERVYLRGSCDALYMRTGDSSDFKAFTQIFLEEEYKPLRAIAAPRVIVDCGSNVGYSSRYLLEAFPSARVIAIEPDPENFRICQLNLEPFRNRASVLQAAVWTHATQLSLSRGAFRDGREWTTQVRRPGEGESADVAAIDIESLLKKEAIDTIDLLKIDIEGSELELFRSECCGNWIRRVKNLAIELHDTDCANTFFAALDGFQYDLEQSGELQICLNIQLPAEDGLRHSAGSIPVRDRSA